jgi:hypothetical protein
MESLEKKNHMQVRIFFTKTRKDGGRNYVAAVKEIMQLENRELYFAIEEEKYDSPFVHSRNLKKFKVK